LKRLCFSFGKDGGLAELWGGVKRYFLYFDEMRKLLFTAFGLILILNVSGQVTAGKLAAIKTVQQAKELISSSPKSEAELFTITSDKDTSGITLPLFDKKPGHVFSIDEFTYKILEADSYPEFRVSFIYLDGNQLPLATIDSLRSEILSKYKSGTYFYDLARAYTMDGDHNGDLGWFGENVMVKEFEVAIRKHKKLDIFPVDIPARKWYYVVLKTYDDRVVKKLTILRVKSGS
jgi:parvulin-like peptidyl-prolyl isomerase